MFIADLHIHSRYSRATSPELCFEQLHAWGQRKGVGLIGTGDCTHPGWLTEIAEKLEPAGDGVYRLRAESAPPTTPAGSEVRFLLTGEISTIYKTDGATRKVHHLVCLPGLDAAARFATRLERIGNIAADGRPILGLDSRDLLEILLDADPAAVLIPAHIWTPWFSVLGSKSGFDTIDACYRDLADHIFAAETGLSSDPPMNWMVSGLDRYTLVSNSDAHSPARLGREANIFSCAMDYPAMMQALRRETDGFHGTLEFFPAEGKYHFDGHRKCNFSCAPEESRTLDGRCPICGGALTLGVEYRVVELADRPRGARPEGARDFQRLLSLAEILGEVWETGAQSKKVTQWYDRLLAEVGPELFILREAELDALRVAGGELLARAIAKMRTGDIHALPGYDGEYGVITIFNEEERAEVLGQIQLFAGLALDGGKQAIIRDPLPTVAAPPPTSGHVEDYSEEQQCAITAPPGPLLIVAGPGAGKTRTLVERLARQVTDGNVDPAAILALTFSNRAARELAERLNARLAASTVHPTVSTFHRLGFRFISEYRERLGLPALIGILAEEDAEDLFAASAVGAETDRVAALADLEPALAEVFDGATGDPTELRQRTARALALAPAYTAAKRARGALDFTDLLLLPLLLLAEHEDVRLAYKQRWRHVVVDEYQDVNVLQYLLLRLLCPAGSDLCVIGDPDQAIYGFRGADVRYFLRFRTDYPDARQVALTRNYRSSRTIVRASAQVIAGNSLLDRRTLWSDLPGPERLMVSALPTPRAEAEYVVQTIEGLLGGISHFSVDSGRGGDGTGHNLGFNDIAVLYRTHALGEDVRLALERSGIPYQRAARQDIFRRPDVRKVVALLALARHPDNAEALAMMRKLDVPECAAHAGALAALSPTRALLEACLVLGITQADLQDAAWIALLRRAEESETLDAYLQRLALERDIDLYDPRAARVALMTAHAAKGLEWAVVFMIGCEEGNFPHPAAPDDEERRLFYVGMTRARTHLYLSHAETRIQHGERAARRVTPYVREIDPALLDCTAPFAGRPAHPRQTQLALFDA